MPTKHDKRKEASESISEALPDLLLTFPFDKCISGSPVVYRTGVIISTKPGAVDKMLPRSRPAPGEEELLLFAIKSRVRWVTAKRLRGLDGIVDSLFDGVDSECGH